MFGNDRFWQECNQSEVEHLIRDGSDHTPLHVVCKTGQEPVKKLFRFLSFWTVHQTFKGEVRKAWKIPVEGSTFKVLNDKIKNVKRALSTWSKVA